MSTQRDETAVRDRIVVAADLLLPRPDGAGPGSSRCRLAAEADAQWREPGEPGRKEGDDFGQCAGGRSWSCAG